MAALGFLGKVVKLKDAVYNFYLHLSGPEGRAHLQQLIFFTFFYVGGQKECDKGSSCGAW